MKKLIFAIMFTLAAYGSTSFAQNVVINCLQPRVPVCTAQQLVPDTSGRALPGSRVKLHLTCIQYQCLLPSPYARIFGN